MDDLVTFLNARLSEDEAAAEACPFDDWQTSGPPGGSVMLIGCTYNGGSHLAEGVRFHDPEYHCLKHAARHDPARVLREVEADRKLLAELTSPDPLAGPEYSAGLRLAAMFRAAVYADHPDYQQEWRTF